MISVIIPSYNRAEYLKEAIQSVLDQDFFSREGKSPLFELIVVDDGSKDKTKEVVQSFGERVKYHYQNQRGVSAARNAGLNLSRGDTIAFLDSDDLWKKEKIRIQMSFMETFPQAKVCYTEEIWIRRGRRLNPKQKHKKYSGWIFEKVLPLCLLSLSSALFRREVFEEIGNFDETLPACEDYDFSIRLAHKYPIYLVSSPLIIKRGGHPDQLSQKYSALDRFRIRALVKALTSNLTSEQERLVRREISKKCEILVKGYEKRGKASQAKKYLRLSEKFAPY